MTIESNNRFSGPVAVFQERRLPERATPAGYAALIDAYDLSVPLPLTLTATGERHRVFEEAGWRILTPRHAPHSTLEGHLTFALKYEGLDLAVLKHLFVGAGPSEIEAVVRAKPTGSYARRIWFLYEWLTGTRLDLPDAAKGSYVPVVDSKRQWAGTTENSPRHRLKNNLPGTPPFCPMVFRTNALEHVIAMDLPEDAREIIADVPRDLLARTAAFLLLKDSKSSYAIEGERAPQDRIQRWGRAIGERLDRHRAIELIVVGGIDHSHSASTELAVDAVAANARRGGHGVPSSLPDGVVGGMFAEIARKAKASPASAPGTLENEPAVAAIADQSVLPIMYWNRKSNAAPAESSWATRSELTLTAAMPARSATSQSSSMRNAASLVDEGRRPSVSTYSIVTQRTLNECSVKTL